MTRGPTKELSVILTPIYRGKNLKSVCVTLTILLGEVDERGMRFYVLRQAQDERTAVPLMVSLSNYEHVMPPMSGLLRMTWSHPGAPSVILVP